MLRKIKQLYLDIIWKFKVDLTPASSGTGGYGYQNVGDGKSYGWSYPKYNMTDDRQRKSLSRPEAIKLMTSVKHISILAKDYRDNLLSCGGASATQSAQSSESNNDVYALAYNTLEIGNTAFTTDTIKDELTAPTLIAYKYAGHTINNSSISKVSVQVQRDITVSYQDANITILLIKKSVATYTILGKQEIFGTIQDINDHTQYQTGWTDHLTETGIKVKTIDFRQTSGWFTGDTDDIYIGISYANVSFPPETNLLDNFFTNTLDASGQVLQNTTVISSLSAATDVGDNIVLHREYPETTTGGPLYLMYYKISIT